MLQKQDIIRVANDIKKQLTDGEIDAVLNEYNQRDHNDSWHIIVEDIIYDIVQTSNPPELRK